MKKLSSYDEAKGKTISAIIDIDFYKIGIVFTDKSYIEIKDDNYSALLMVDNYNGCDVSVSEINAYNGTIIEEDMKLYYADKIKEQKDYERNRELERITKLKKELKELEEKHGIKE
jgi:hypothetical protein